MEIVNFSYDQHFHPNEFISFVVRVHNSESTNQGAELLILLTKVGTGETIEAADVGSGAGAVLAGGNFTFNTTIGPQKAGTYTVTFRLLDGAALRSDQVNGKFPIHVGTETESIRVFPEVIHLGTLPAGRTLHPTPIEVSWSFFRFNQLRVDQPFVVRIYTDNAARYVGIPGALRRGSPGGLVSLDGRYTIPVKFWSLNAGPDLQETGWDSALAGPPPVDDDNAWLGPPLLEGSRHFGGASWVRVKDRAELGASPFGWSRGEGIIGQDPHDNRYANEKNITGDFTLTSPFTFYLATETSAATATGTYSATLVVELWTP